MRIKADRALLLRASVCVMACALIPLAVAACGGSTSTSAGKEESASDASLTNVPFQGEGKPTDGGVLTFARGLEPSTMFPWTEPSTANNPVQKQIFDGLVEASPDPSKITPALATSWNISKNHLVYTFHLRPNVKFSNGQPLKASDVKYSLELGASPKTNPLGYILLDRIKAVTTPSPSEVQVTLSKVTPAFLANLTTSMAVVVPESVVKQIGVEAFAFHPVGTGPFMVTKFAPGDPEIVLKKNPYYWDKPMPYLNGVIYKYVANDNARVLAARSGSADIAENVPYSQVRLVESSPGISLVKQHTFAEDWIQINGCKAPLNDAKVREALAYATPLKQLQSVVFKGLASVPATANLPTKYLDNGIKPLPYDPEKAKELLKEAGASNLSLTMLDISGDSVAAQVATILQAAWEQIGVKLSIQQTDLTSSYAQMEKGDYDLGNLTPTAIVSDVPVDDEFDELVAHSPELGQFPWTCWNSPKASALVDRATTTWGEAARRKLFSEYQQLLRDEQPIIGVAYIANLFAVRDSVHNFVSVGAVWPLLKEVWLQE